MPGEDNCTPRHLDHIDKNDWVVLDDDDDEDDTLDDIDDGDE